MVANVEAMVRAGIEAYRAGKASEARKLLEKAIELDDYNEQAWMWLSAVVETDEEKRTCLENVLVINPNNEEAKTGLNSLGIADSSAAADDAGGSSANPFTDTGMNDFGDVDFALEEEEDEGWSVPTSSASASFGGEVTSAQEYDDWVDNLNIGESSPTDDDFGDDDLGNDMGSFDDSLDTFGSDMFGLDDDDDDPFSGDVNFGSDDNFDEFEEFDDFDSADALTSGPFGSGGMDDDFDLEDEPVASAQSTPASAPVMSPGAENISNNILGDLGTAELSGGDFIIGDESFESSGDQQEYTPDELFSFIPDEIKATRLPGTARGVSAISMVVFVVLIVMNVAAIGFVVSSLS